MSAALLVVVALLGAEVPAPGPSSLSSDRPVGFAGIGPIRVGQPLWQLVGLLHGPITIEEVNNDCTFVYSDAAQGISFMIVGGVVARLDISARTYATSSGARVGDSEARVHELYGARVATRDHAYVDGHYLTVESTDRKYALVFETDGSKVISFRIGRLPEALHIEGCS